MKQILFAIAFTALAAMPASASTSFPFSCNFEGGGYGMPMVFSLFAEGGGYYGEKPIWWHEVGSTTLIVENNDRNWVIVAWDNDTGEAIMPYLHATLLQGTCRVGTE